LKISIESPQAHGDSSLFPYPYEWESVALQIWPRSAKNCGVHISRTNKETDKQTDIGV